MQYRNKNPGLRPLTARSIVLSTLLGTHPPRLRARHLVRAGALFGVPEGTIRVALSRMVADGELVVEDGAYRLTGRLLERQARQDESRAPQTRAWRGRWEVAVVTAQPRRPAERAALRSTMTALRLAELREGVWLRPANLVRAIPAEVAAQCRLFQARPEGDPAALAASLWDLDGWAERARLLLEAMEDTDGLAEAFMVSAAIIRHLLTDPLLPAELVPPGWPGRALRESHERYEARYRHLLREYLRG